MKSRRIGIMNTPAANAAHRKVLTIKVVLILIILWSSCSRSKKSEIASESKEALVITNSAVAPSVIYRSTDLGKTWMPYANGIPEDATVSSFLSDGTTTYATTDAHGLYVIKEGVAKWLRIDMDLPEGVDINAITAINHVLIIGTYKHGIFISRNDGRNWEQWSVSIKHTPIRSLLAYSKIVFAGADDGIYRSIDFGSTWQQVFKGVQTNGFTVLHNKIYAAVMNGAIMTEDDGAKWKYVYQPRALHDISNDGESVYAMTLGDGLLKSNNDGLSWESVNDGFGATRWYTFEVKNIDDQLFAAQWHGIYTSDKRGGKWQMMKNGLPDSTAFSTLEATAWGLMAGIGLRKE